LQRTTRGGLAGGTSKGGATCTLTSSGFLSGDGKEAKKRPSKTALAREKGGLGGVSARRAKGGTFRADEKLITGQRKAQEDPGRDLFSERLLHNHNDTAADRAK